MAFVVQMEQAAYMVVPELGYSGDEVIRMNHSHAVEDETIEGAAKLCIPYPWRAERQELDGPPTPKGILRYEGGDCTSQTMACDPDIRRLWVRFDEGVDLTPDGRVLPPETEVDEAAFLVLKHDFGIRLGVLERYGASDGDGDRGV